MVFAGFDIGTTHIKYLILDNDGRIIDIHKENSKFINKKNILYFDLPYIENFVFDSIAKINKKYLLQSISIASIGESVVPVCNGKAAAFPLSWDSKCTENIADTALCKAIQKYALYKNVGTKADYTFSIYKIYWMKKYLGLESVDYWLPLSSYLNYLLTGRAVWCESHACRSLLYDIYRGAWIPPLLESIGVQEAELGNIQYTGSAIGTTKNNLLIALSGHDHITGLFGIHKLNQNRPFVYQSMGTSSVIAAIVKSSNAQRNGAEENEFCIERPFAANQRGKIGKAFAPNQFFVQNSFRYFGSLFENFLLFCGCRNDDPPVIAGALPKEIAVFAVENDPISGIAKDRFPIIHMPDRLSQADAIQSLYIYLAVASSFALQELKAFIDVDFCYYIGGGFSQNHFLVNYLAAALQKPLLRLHTEEVTALGAAISALYGSNPALLEDCTKNIKIDFLYPKTQYIQKMEIYKNIYRKWIDKA